MGLAESALFNGLRLLATPAWIRFQTVSPQPRWLSYADLLRLASRYHPIPKPSPATQRNRQLKWARRVAEIANIYQANAILEVGCGNGLAIDHLRRRGFWATGIDIQPILASQINQSQNYLALADACSRLPFTDGQFDLVFSIDSLEHFQNPTAALMEMLRVLKPGGVLYAAFGPLYFSPWGLHAERRLGMPYPQLLFTAEAIQRYVDKHRDQLAETYEATSDRSQISPPLNGFSLQRFREILNAQRFQLSHLVYVEQIDLTGLEFITRYANLLKARVPSFTDLIVARIKFVAVKQCQPTS